MVTPQIVKFDLGRPTVLTCKEPEIAVTIGPADGAPSGTRHVGGGGYALRAVDAERIWSVSPPIHVHILVAASNFQTSLKSVATVNALGWAICSPRSHVSERRSVTGSLRICRLKRSPYTFRHKQNWDTLRPGTMACSCESRVLYLRHMNEDEVDITERRMVEQALRESEERFRLATKAGRMFTYSWDAATDVIERSGESAKILGIDEAALLTGHQAIARVHPDDREGLLAAMAGLSPEKPFLQVTYRIVRPDQSVILVERHSRAYFDERGKMKRIVGMVVDITEKKRAEVAVLRHAAIVESSDDAIIGVDMNGIVTDWNKGAERVFGYSAKEAMGRNISFLSPADRSEDGLNILKNVISGKAVKQYETVRRRKDGTHIERASSACRWDDCD